MSTQRIAFQGEHGAFSEEAIRQHFGPEAESLPCHSFEDIFTAVDEGRAQFGVVPVENSVAGSINKSYDLLLEYDLKIWGEIFLRVRHNLMALPGITLEAITEVRSHPQALAQCERFLNRYGWPAKPWYDTAGSAKDLAQSQEANVAVIASQLAAQIYNLEILAPGIEDMTANYTRFFVIGRGDAPYHEKAKTSLVFATFHNPGALVACLNEFASRNINLTKLESRPRRNRPWHYVFHLDFEGHWQDERQREALTALLSRAAFVKLLGSYPAATMPSANTSGQAELLQI